MSKCTSAIKWNRYYLQALYTSRSLSGAELAAWMKKQRIQGILLLKKYVTIWKTQL
jgi:hypothetical protein